MINKFVSPRNTMPQLDLFGVGNKSKEEHSYFFALSPPNDVRLQLAAVADHLKSDHAIDGSWIARERYHLTLHHLGKFPEARIDLVNRAIAAANKIQVRSFDILLDQFMCFDSKIGNFPCVATSAAEMPELNHFWQLLKNNLYAVRLGEHLANSFKPHATMLYSKRPISERHSITPIHWRVKDFVLIESLVGKSEHVELGRWPLQNLK
jgi:RNA 2',3'-cyclic 3'-phosphodiesterase